MHPKLIKMFNGESKHVLKISDSEFLLRRMQVGLILQLGYDRDKRFYYFKYIVSKSKAEIWKIRIMLRLTESMEFTRLAN